MQATAVVPERLVEPVDPALLRSGEAVVILGAGAAGLALAAALVRSGWDRPVLAARRAPQAYPNDRTWCFWSADGDPAARLATAAWHEWIVRTDGMEVRRRPSGASRTAGCAASTRYGASGSPSSGRPAACTCVSASGSSGSTSGPGEPPVVRTASGTVVPGVLVDCRGPRLDPERVAAAKQGGVWLGQEFLGQRIRADRPGVRLLRGGAARLPDPAGRRGPVHVRAPHEPDHRGPRGERAVRPGHADRRRRAPPPAHGAPAAGPRPPPRRGDGARRGAGLHPDDGHPGRSGSGAAALRPRAAAPARRAAEHRVRLPAHPAIGRRDRPGDPRRGPRAAPGGIRRMAPAAARRRVPPVPAAAPHRRAGRVRADVLRPHPARGAPAVPWATPSTPADRLAATAPLCRRRRSSRSSGASPSSGSARPAAPARRASMSSLAVSADERQAGLPHAVARRILLPVDLALAAGRPARRRPRARADPRIQDSCRPCRSSSPSCCWGSRTARSITSSRRASPGGAGRGPVVTVVVLYALFGGADLALWTIAPAAGFVGFILLTWFHWGQGDLFVAVRRDPLLRCAASPARRTSSPAARSPCCCRSSPSPPCTAR